MICQRPLDEVATIIRRAPQLLDLVDGRGLFPLHMAAAGDDLGITKFMLSEGAAANVTTTPGLNTPLHLAYANPDMVRILLEHGALVSALNKWQKRCVRACDVNRTKEREVERWRRWKEGASKMLSTFITRQSPVY